MGLKPQRLLFILFNIFLLTSLVCLAENITENDTKTLNTSIEEVEEVSEIIDTKKEETLIKDDKYVGPIPDDKDKEMEVIPIVQPEAKLAPVKVDTEKAPQVGKSMPMQPKSGAYVMEPPVMAARLENDFGE